LRAKFQALKDWFREQLTKPTAEAWQTLRAKLHGHYQYHNVNDNWRGMMKYREAARRMGLRWLRRRSQNALVSWEAYSHDLVPCSRSPQVCKGHAGQWMTSKSKTVALVLVGKLLKGGVLSCNSLHSAISMLLSDG
jgi:hypothetical protein